MGGDGPAAFARRTLLPASAVLLAVGLVLQGLSVVDDGFLRFARESPAFFFVRLGSVAGVLAGFAMLSQRIARGPSAVTALSQESLLVYLVHVCLLYGSVWNPGLRQVFGSQFGPGAALAWIAVLLAGMTVMAWAWFEAKRSRPALAAHLRVAAAAFLILPLL